MQTTTQPESQSRQIVYFRFRPDVTEDIQQTQYDLLETYLNQHRGRDEAANDLNSNGYWAVVATSEKGMGDDAVEYTKTYLQNLDTVDPTSITTTPPESRR